MKYCPQCKEVVLEENTSLDLFAMPMHSECLRLVCTPTVVIIQKEQAGYRAEIEDHPEWFATGQFAEQALGSLILEYQDKFLDGIFIYQGVE